MKRLQDRVVGVSGGASGIGTVICELFASEGASSAINGLGAESGQEIVERVAKTCSHAVFHED